MAADVNGRFAWVDLSTFDVSEARTFYSAVFEWTFRGSEADYGICVAGHTAAAGLYEMPDRFQAINMPSFWMSYVQVDDLEHTVAVAEQAGARIELGPQPGPGDSRVALVRDPAGAGFTLVEGDLTSAARGGAEAGLAVWQVLHVSDLSRVQPFYETVFGWRIGAATGSGRFDLYSADGTQPVAGVQVTPNDVKGNAEYWGVYFAVADLEGAAEAIAQAGGETVSAEPLGAQPTRLAFDPQGAAFYIVALVDPVRENKTRTIPHWRAITGLFLVAMAVLLEANWLWGLLFLLWVVPDLQKGSTHFFERIDRRDSPVLFWAIASTWLGLSVYLLLEPLVFR